MRGVLGRLLLRGGADCGVELLLFKLYCRVLDAVLVEAGFDQRDQRLQGLWALRSLRGEVQRRARAGGEHHEPHDRRAPDHVTLAGDGDGGIEGLGELDELR